jgi:SAM-dependent methyltransferase
MRVLDACSAPGGKTVQAALRMNGEGYVLATDCWADRLEPLRENLARFGLNALVEVRQLDARRATIFDVEERFDRILLDVPCSNTGVQRRRADAKWRFTPDRLKELNDTQYAILSNAAKLLKPGGKLVYSTCSLEKEENDDIVRKFLKEHPEFTRGEVRFSMPAVSGMDGAFAACLILDSNYKYPAQEKRSPAFNNRAPSKEKRGKIFTERRFDKPFEKKREQAPRRPRNNSSDTLPRKPKQSDAPRTRTYDPRPQAAPRVEQTPKQAKKQPPTIGDTRW